MKIRQVIISGIISTFSLINCASVEADTFKITFTDNLYDLKCPVIIQESKAVNLEIIKAEKCTDVHVEVLNNSITEDFTYSPYKKKGVLTDVLDFKNLA